MAMNMNSPRAELNFKISLLSGKTVVLVDCPGYESELFMPQIVKGRISFMNIIPNRRCCDVSNVSVRPLVFKGVTLTEAKSATGSPIYPMQNIGNMPSPLARSTPSSGHSAATKRSRCRLGKENIPPNSQLLTPERPRDKPTADLDFPSSFPSPQAAQSSSHIRSLVTHLSPDSRSQPDLSLSTPPTSTYNMASIETREAVVSNLMHKAAPIRTYSRRKSNALPKVNSWSPLQKKKKISTAVSTTKPPNPIMKLEIRTRKLIVDNKKSLGAFDPDKVPTPVITKKKIVRKQVTGKTKKQFEALQRTAFDLLTTPGHQHMSQALTQQFQLACMDKSCTTLPNYAEVADTGPLDIDREVKSLIAKQKRVERMNAKPRLAPSMIRS